MDRILEKIREFNALKDEYKLKVAVFDLIKNKEIDKARKILEKNNNILSYFIKFKHKTSTGRLQEIVIVVGVGGKWNINYQALYENEVAEDLKKIKKEIEEKENRLEQYAFLKQQREFIELQKKDIEENKEDRKKIRNFTFILALGVISATSYYLFQVITKFKETKTLHLFIISGIFIILFVFLIFFIFDNFKVGKHINYFFKDNLILIILVVLVIIVLFLLLFVLPDVSFNNISENNVEKPENTSLNTPVNQNMSSEMNQTNATELIDSIIIPQ